MLGFFHSWILHKKKKIADATNVAGGEKNDVEFIFFLNLLRMKSPLQYDFTCYFPRYLRGDILRQRK